MRPVGGISHDKTDVHELFRKSAQNQMLAKA